MFYDWERRICKYRIGISAEILQDDKSYAVYVQQTANFYIKSKSSMNGNEAKKVCDAYASYFPSPKNGDELNKMIAKYGKFFTGKNLFLQENLVVLFDLSTFL